MLANYSAKCTKVTHITCTQQNTHTRTYHVHTLINKHSQVRADTLTAFTNSILYYVYVYMYIYMTCDYMIYSYTSIYVYVCTYICIDVYIYINTDIDILIHT